MFSMYIPNIMESKYFIYKITIDNELYIGSTCNFEQRKAQHKSDCHNEKSPRHNQKIYQKIRELGGWGNVSIDIVEILECNNRVEALAREEHWRQEYNANLNKNKAYLSPEEFKDYQHKHYVDNKDVICEKARILYKKTNGDYKKKYYEANKDVICQKAREKYNKVAKKMCESAKEKYKINRDEAIIYSRKWREQNANKIKEYKEKYMKNEVCKENQRGYARECNRRTSLYKRTNDFETAIKELMACLI